MADPTTGVLLMALGGPNSLDDVESFLRDIRRGRPTPSELVDEFRERYRRIGGKSPLLEISQAQGAALENRLNEMSGPFRVYVGMRHWHPYIRDVVQEISQDGIERLVAVCLTPYNSRMSVGAYFDALDEGLARSRSITHVVRVESWNDAPALIDAYANKLRDGLQRMWSADIPDPFVLFTAHSLPKKILEDGDPYEGELHETMELILKKVPAVRSKICYQSAGRTPEPWLGPQFEHVIDEIGSTKETGVLVCPFGFVSDHVEILYDVDIEARERAAHWGMRLERTESLNTDPRFIDALSRTVLRAGT